MAKQPHSPAPETKTPLPPRGSTTRPNASTVNNARRSTVRRGSVTKPVKKTPWGAIITGALVVIGVIVVIVVAVSQNRGAARTTAAGSTPGATVAVGAPIPDFTVKSQEGKTLTKADSVGKPTLIVFFASWCPHCQAEAPRIVQIAKANPDLNVVMIGVGDRETQADIYSFAGKYGLPFPTFADPTAQDLGKTAQAWGITGYPTLFAVDKTGIVRDRNENPDGSVGGEVTPDQLQRMVTKAKG